MKKTILPALLVLSVATTSAKEIHTINNNWLFRLNHSVEKNNKIRIDLPHTWNNQDALAGASDYHRGIGNYERNLEIPIELQGKRLFLKFNGANTVASVFVNGKYCTEHRGGYSAFTVEVTDKVNYGATNKIMVRVNNAPQFDVMPLVGDFNFYGGMYRDVELIVSEQTTISPLHYSSSGVYLLQTAVSREKACGTATVMLSSTETRNATAVLTICDHTGKAVFKKQQQFTVTPSTESIEIPYEVASPRLWNGTKDPYLYSATVELIADGKPIDSVCESIGFRYFTVDPNKGLLLNGEHTPLHGVCRHQDRAERGNALLPEHHREDIALIREMGANAIRLAHYQQDRAVYRLADSTGIVIWAEIPFVGPGGYADKGFIDSDSFKANGIIQLKELIYQNFNHPSILFWGLFNELKSEGDNPLTYIKELNDIARKCDPSRITTAASNQSDPINFVTDLIAWNRYDGWYGGSPADLGRWADATHKAHPDLRIAISEYGAGASVYHQQDSVVQTNPTSMWHPENWQTLYHIENYKVISSRPYIWGSFVWNMFDFGAAHRKEGDSYGRNDKGLVSFDRKVKKDAFYFYKANWNKEDKFVYIASHRATEQTKPTTDILVFSNCGKVELKVNGKTVSTQSPDNYQMCRWENILLQKGENVIEAVSGTFSHKAIKIYRPL